MMVKIADPNLRSLDLAVDRDVILAAGCYDISIELALSFVYYDPLPTVRARLLLIPTTGGTSFPHKAVDLTSRFSVVDFCPASFVQENPVTSTGSVVYERYNALLYLDPTVQYQDYALTAITTYLTAAVTSILSTYVDANDASTLL